MNEVVAGVVPIANPMVLSGPSFASDVEKGLPTAVVLAASRIGRGPALGRSAVPAAVPDLCVR